jgi:prepilin-type N-terminal cleavage/methylation domain-containing protein
MTDKRFIELNRSQFTPALSNNAGFTLIEVLIAAAITSMIIAALYSTFFLSRRAVDAVDDSLVKLQESRAVLDAVKREIESAVYSGEKTYTLFKLDDRDLYGKQASQLLFTSFSPLRPGLSKIAYTAEENDGKLILKKKVEAAYGGPVETRDVDLMEDIESFTVEAKYKETRVKTWDSTVSGGLPDELRISLSFRIRKEESPFTISDVARPRAGKIL